MTFVHPATIIVSGGTGSGKTVLTRAVITHHQFTFAGLDNSVKPQVLWCFGVYQPLFSEPLENTQVTFHEGMIDEQTLADVKPDILVIDDLMNEKANDPFTHNLFTRVSHHKRVTVIFITQNLYEKGQCKMKRNAHYIVLMRNPSDKSQLTTLGRQLFPRKRSLLEHFYESYDDATRNRYGYLVIDVSPTSDEREKLKTNILPCLDGSMAVVVYQPK